MKTQILKSTILLILMVIFSNTYGNESLKQLNSMPNHNIYLSTFEISNEIEPDIELQEWMTDDISWKSVETNFEIEKLYPLLIRLKNARMLSIRWEESQQGPPRKYYELTPGGSKVLEELKESWDEIVEAVEIIKKS